MGYADVSFSSRSAAYLAIVKAMDRTRRPGRDRRRRGQPRLDRRRVHASARRPACRTRQTVLGFYVVGPLGSPSDPWPKRYLTVEPARRLASRRYHECAAIGRLGGPVRDRGAPLHDGRASRRRGSPGRAALDSTTWPSATSASLDPAAARRGRPAGPVPRSVRHRRPGARLPRRQLARAACRGRPSSGSHAVVGEEWGGELIRGWDHWLDEPAAGRRPAGGARSSGARPARSSSAIRRRSTSTSSPSRPSTARPGRRIVVTDRAELPDRPLRPRGPRPPTGPRDRLARSGSGRGPAGRPTSRPRWPPIRATSPSSP